MQDPVILILTGPALRGAVWPDPVQVQPADPVGTAARLARAALSTGLRVAAVLPPERPALRAAFPAGRIRCVLSGAMDPLAAGLATLPAGAPVLLAHADQTALRVEDLRQMLAAWRATPELILRASDAEGTPGHPLCLPLWARTMVSDTADLAALLRRHAGRMRLFPLQADHATASPDPAELDPSDRDEAPRIARPSLAARRAALMRPSAPAPRTV